jgi:hypothetical protein
MKLHIAGHSVPNPSRMPFIMGLIAPESSASPARPGPRELHVIPTALGRDAQVFARALVDELGGTDRGHTLVSLFDGETGVRVDQALDLPGGVNAASRLHPPALARLITLMAAVRDMRLPYAAALEPLRIS